jgi:tRNA (guanine37-N1)-methyltransferase
MEVVAGDDDTVANVSEQGCRFKFDFATVYWNSRLGTEHTRLVESFAPGSVIADACAGVGPFALPAARNRGCTVHANDLNPESHRWLVHNAAANKLDGSARAETNAKSEAKSETKPETKSNTKSETKSETKSDTKSETKSDANSDTKRAKRSKSAPRAVGTVHCTNLDAAEFLSTVVPRVSPDHIVINLPASSVEFLHHIPRGALRPTARVHCYTFADVEADAEDPAAEYVIFVLQFCEKKKTSNSL